MILDYFFFFLYPQPTGGPLSLFSVFDDVDGGRIFPKGIVLVVPVRLWLKIPCWELRLGFLESHILEFPCLIRKCVDSRIGVFRNDLTV